MNVSSLSTILLKVSEDVIRIILQYYGKEHQGKYVEQLDLSKYHIVSTIPRMQSCFCQTRIYRDAKEYRNYIYKVQLGEYRFTIDYYKLYECYHFCKQPIGDICAVANTTRIIFYHEHHGWVKFV